MGRGLLQPCQADSRPAASVGGGQRGGRTRAVWAVRPGCPGSRRAPGPPSCRTDTARPTAVVSEPLGCVFAPQLAALIVSLFVSNLQAPLSPGNRRTPCPGRPSLRAQPSPGVSPQPLQPVRAEHTFQALRSAPAPAPESSAECGQRAHICTRLSVNHSGVPSSVQAATVFFSAAQPCVKGL